MRTARKFLLLALTALAAMALAATNASASSAVEIVDEATSNPCSPCVVHMEGEGNINALPSGVEISSCHDEYEGNIYHDGTGEMEWVGSAHGAPGCNTKHCEVTPGESHWQVHSTEEVGPGITEMHIEFCLSPLNAPTTELMCEADVTATEPTQHDYQSDLHAICFGGTREFEGRWLIEDDEHDSIELEHL